MGNVEHVTDETEVFIYFDEQTGEPSGEFGIEFTPEGTGVQVEVRSRWHLVDGRGEPYELRVITEGAPVTASMVRNLPLGEAMSAMHDVFLDRVRVRTISMLRHPSQMEPEVQTELVNLLRSMGPQRGRRRTDEELEAVAYVYRQAWEARKPVTEAVATACKISRSTAGKRIMAARKAGLLEGIGRTQ
jgi:hypothetical protein